MGKFFLYYKKHSDTMLGNVLKIKIDNDITAEVAKNGIYELEIKDGVHNIKMYYEGWSKDELVGYIDKDIEIKGDTYYTYKGPATIYGKGKLSKNEFNSPTEFKNYKHKDKKIHKILGIIAFIIAIIVYIIIEFLK